MLNNLNLEIQELLHKFMLSFDNKDFSIMKDCLCEEVYLDYSSFRGDLPAKQTSSAYCENRQESLANLVTQHNLLNLLIKINDDNLTAKVNCNFIIYRFLKEYQGSRDDFFHSYGQYEFKLICENNKWLIASIIQKITMNDGNKNIHKGIKQL